MPLHGASDGRPKARGYAERYENGKLQDYAQNGLTKEID